MDLRLRIEVAALSFAIVCSSADPCLAQEKVKLAVLDFRSKGAEAGLVENLTDVATVSLNKLGVFDVLSRADIQQMLQFEEEKQMVGCESDASCLAELGGALGVALLVNGSIGKVGNNYLVSMTLTNTSTVTVLAREQREVTEASKLTEAVEWAARLLVRDLLKGQQGHLVLKASETAAEVELDGHLIGVTPLPRQTLAGGPHAVKVSKKGFITWARDFEVEKDQATVLDALLVPSLEFIDDYESGATTWRVLAYVAGGVGLAAIGAGIGIWQWNDAQASRYERDLETANCHQGATGQPTGSCNAFESRFANIQTFDLVAQALVWSGAAALAAGTFAFFYGPSPGLYDAYRPGADDAVKVGLVVAPKGAAAVGVFAF